MRGLAQHYFEWLLTELEPDGVSEELAYLCGLLHSRPFERRVGNDINRAVDGANLRKRYFNFFDREDYSEEEVADLMDLECSWFEMLVALAVHLDFIYDGGVENRFVELCRNLGLDDIFVFRPRRTKAREDSDRQRVCDVTSDVDNNRFDEHGHGGLFPLFKGDHFDQRREEIWDQHAAYFREKLEGVLWTSTS